MPEASFSLLEKEEALEEDWLKVALNKNVEEGITSASQLCFPLTFLFLSMFSKMNAWHFPKSSELSAKSMPAVTQKEGTIDL